MELLERILAEMSGIEKPNSRPLVTLSYAQSLDGSIALRRGVQTRISNEASARLTHQLRANHDAILVGIGTVLADDPRLTVRLVSGKNPQPVILDSHLRTPPGSALVREGKPWIATTLASDPEKAENFVAQGVELLHLPHDTHGQVMLPELLGCLSRMGVDRLMVEGGATVISRFLSMQLVDYLVITIAPLILGGLPAVNFSESIWAESSQEYFPGLGDMVVEMLGEDMIISGMPSWRPLLRY